MSSMELNDCLTSSFRLKPLRSAVQLVCMGPLLALGGPVDGAVWAVLLSPSPSRGRAGAEAQR